MPFMIPEERWRNEDDQGVAKMKCLSPMTWPGLKTWHCLIHLFSQMMFSRYYTLEANEEKDQTLSRSGSVETTPLKVQACFEESMFSGNMTKNVKIEIPFWMPKIKVFLPSLIFFLFWTFTGPHMADHTGLHKDMQNRYGLLVSEIFLSLP